MGGFVIDDEIGNLYVHGQKTRVSPSAPRYATDFATAPIDNFITEVLPDIPRRTHTRFVPIKKIVNQVFRSGSQST